MSVLREIIIFIFSHFRLCIYILEIPRMIRLKLVELTDLIDLMNASAVNFSQVPGFIDLNKSRANSLGATVDLACIQLQICLKYNCSW